MIGSRLCGCSFVHPGRTLSEGLEWVAQRGFQYVDIGVGGANAHFNPIDVATDPQSFAIQVMEQAKPHRLIPNECFTLHFGWPINSPDAGRRDQTARLFVGLCRFAAAARFASILLIPGPVHPEIGPEKSFDLSVAALNELAKIAVDHGLRLHVEADMDSCANTPELADELCCRAAGLHLTLDYSHFICQGIDPQRVDRLFPHVRHVHVRQAAPGRIATPVEQGTIDFRRIINQLETGGYRGLYCIEYLAIDPEHRTAAMLDQLAALSSADPDGRSNHTFAAQRKD
jgi:sugar phosphate isomerase/epimerase